MQDKVQKRKRRHIRVRARIKGTAERPRLSVFRSNKYIYAQLIDDDLGKILVSANDVKSKEKKSKMDQAKEIGKLIAQAASKMKVEEVVFDRGGYKYHGRVKAVAEGAREGGLKF